MKVSELFLPPSLFGTVDMDLYRGSYPAIRNFPLMKTLNLKSILSLTPDLPGEKLKEFCKENKIDSYHVRVDVPDDKVAITYNKLSQILRLISNRDLRPMYIHCTNGERVTGVVLMCYRKTLNWSLGSIKSESGRYTKTGAVTKRDEEYVIKFSINQDTEV